MAVVPDNSIIALEFTTSLLPTPRVLPPEYVLPVSPTAPAPTLTGEPAVWSVHAYTASQSVCWLKQLCDCTPNLNSVGTCASLPNSLVCVCMCVCRAVCYQSVRVTRTLSSLLFGITAVHRLRRG